MSTFLILIINKVYFNVKSFIDSDSLILLKRKGCHIFDCLKVIGNYHFSFSTFKNIHRNDFWLLGAKNNNDKHTPIKSLIFLTLPYERRQLKREEGNIIATLQSVKSSLMLTFYHCHFFDHACHTLSNEKILTFNIYFIN